LLLKYEEKKSKDMVKTLGKKEKELMKKTTKVELETHAKLFNQRQEHRTVRFGCESRIHGLLDVDTIRWKVSHWVQQEQERNFQEIVNLKKKHTEKEYQMNIQAAEELFQLYNENLQNLHPVELANLKQIQELELTHLGKQQFVEARQQQDLLASDHKTQQRDLNTKKAADEKRLQNAVKEYKKDNKKKLSKAQAESYAVQQKTAWEAEWQQKFIAFMKEQKDQKEEEESLLKAHHASQTEKSKLQCDEQIKALISSYENEKIEIAAKYKENIDKLEHFYWTTLLEFTKISSKNKHEMASSNFETEAQLAKNIISEHQRLHESFKEEFKAFGGLHELPVQQIEDFNFTLDALAQDLLKTEALRISCLAVMQAEELDEIDELNTKEEKQVVSKAPPGVFEGPK